MTKIKSDIMFEKFEIIECLKKDSHSSVYIANHIYLGKKIILKTLDRDEMPDESILERFKREAKILAQLDHPNIIKVLDFGTHGNYFYISFEYFESSNLRSVIKDINLPEPQKKDIIIQLLEALNAAHQNGIIHRDIKPENILINKQNVLKIADFGLAVAQDDISVTHKSSIVGTPGYMSPEQIRGDKLTNQTDLFSVGIVIYELYSGLNPFVGKDISETINTILNFNDKEIFNSVNEFPDDVYSVVEKLLKKNPKERTENASDILKTLGVAVVDYSIKDNGINSERKKSFLLYASVLVIILLAGFLARSYWNSDGDSPGQVSNNLNTGQIDTLSNHNETNVIKNNELVDSEKNISIKEINTAANGILRIDAYPWAEVFIDNRSYDKTPLRENIELKEGTYKLKLLHPDFPAYSKNIKIQSGKSERVKINFNNITGKLDCKVIPWGDIYLNGEKKGTTPLLHPLNLMPGNYSLEVRNDQLGKIKELKIKIKGGETASYVINLDENTDR